MRTNCWLSEEMWVKMVKGNKRYKLPVTIHNLLDCGVQYGIVYSIGKTLSSTVSTWYGGGGYQSYCNDRLVRYINVD